MAAMPFNPTLNPGLAPLQGMAPPMMNHYRPNPSLGTSFFLFI